MFAGANFATKARSDGLQWDGTRRVIWLLVVHTYVELSAERAAIRVISARRPTRREIRTHENG